MTLQTETVDATWLEQMRREHAEFARQRDVLARAIHKAALEAGIINGEVPLDGPQLLMVLDDLARDYVRVKGIEPEIPPRPGSGEGLPRYGIRWNGPMQPIAAPMDDGYWTPWHLAELATATEAMRKNAERYVWLRDKSEPFNPFYISVPLWLDGVKFRPEAVDDGIDAAMALDDQVSKASSAEEGGKA